MPLYLANWQDLSFSFITAEDEEDLMLKLDEIGLPGTAKYIEYNGPICLDFRLDVDMRVNREDAGQVIMPKDISIEDASRVRSDPKVLLTEHTTESGNAMWDAIMQFVFPNLDAHHNELYKGRYIDEEEKAEQDLLAALKKDLHKVFVDRLGLDRRKN